MNKDEFIQSARSVLSDVLSEFHCATQTWGIQNHSTRVSLMVLLEEVGEVVEAEQFLELLDTAWGRDALYQELIQVAAMAVMCADSLKRNGYKRHEEDEKTQYIRNSLRRASESGVAARAYLTEHYYPNGLHTKNSEPLG